MKQEPGKKDDRQGQSGDADAAATEPASERPRPPRGYDDPLRRERQSGLATDDAEPSVDPPKNDPD